MRLRKLMLLSTLVLAVAALNPVTAQAATTSIEHHDHDHDRGGGRARPLRGTETATAVVNIVTNTATVDGTFRYTHLGNGTFHADTTLTPLTSTTTHIAGTNTYVAANGDKVFTTLSGTSTQTSTGSEVTIVDTITGGTGRFAGARGTFIVTGPAVTVSFVFPLVTSTGTNTVHGWISY